MSNESKISWTGPTWNLLEGCEMVSEGCKNCYAMRTAHRLSQNPKLPGRYQGVTKQTARGPVWTGTVKLAPDHMLQKPISWKTPKKIFVCLMSDLFHQDVPFEFLQKVFGVMAFTPRHTYQILTKRSQNILKFFRWLSQNVKEVFPLPNVWLGTSVENQACAKERIPWLLKTPARVRFLSCEPLLGPLDLTPYLADIDWVILGGESGPKYRPMKMEWARAIRDQCEAAGVPLWFKQQSGKKSEYRPFLEEVDGTHSVYQNFPSVPSQQIEPVSEKTERAGQHELPF